MWGDQMQRHIRTVFTYLLLSSLLLAPGAAHGQRRMQQAQAGAPAYDLTRETVLEGTVSKYTENSNVPPLGAHVIVQTASGTTDVHVGTDKFLRDNNLVLAPGDSVRIIGENISYRQGTIFAARVIQKGGQSVAVRTTKGMPLWTVGARAQAAAGRQVQQGGPR